jgi:hypothetical protein
MDTDTDPTVNVTLDRRQGLPPPKAASNYASCAGCSAHKTPRWRCT